MAKHKQVVLVYQAGIANVFEVASFNLADYGRDAKRVYQGDFYGGQQLARGYGMAGALVHTAACNQAGDISSAHWTDDLENQPFSDKLVEVRYSKCGIAD